MPAGVAVSSTPGIEPYVFKPGENQRTPLFVYVATMFAVLGGLLFGYDCGVVAGAMVVLQQELGDEKLSPSWTELLVSITTAAAAVFALIGGPLNDWLGRKWMTIFSSFWFAVGSVILAVSGLNDDSTTLSVLLVGRIIVGAAIGMSSMTVPSYIAETTPAHIRGPLVTCFQLSITIGFFLAGLIDAAFSYIGGRLSWRLMFGVAAIPAAIRFVAFFFMPESPRWLIVHEKREEAMRVLKKICPSEGNAQYEYDSIVRVHEDAVKELKARGGGPVLFIMLRSAAMRRALTVGCLLQVFQQLCGINTVMYYSTSIIIMGGVRDPQTAIWFTCITSGVNFICTFPGIYIIEKSGRRKLLLGSMIGVISCLIVLAVAFLEIRHQAPLTDPDLYNVNKWLHDLNGTKDFNNTIMQCMNTAKVRNCDDCSYLQNCGFCYPNSGNHSGACVPRTQAKMKDQTSLSGQFAAMGDCNYNQSIANPTQKTGLNNDDFTFAAGWCPNSISWLPILGMVVYLCSFSMGFGPVPWTINAEMYPQWARSTGNALATATNWAFNLLISATFLSLAEQITRYGAYFLYAGITTLGWIIFFFIVPETKHKSLEELDKLFTKPWCGDRAVGDEAGPAVIAPDLYPPRYSSIDKQYANEDIDYSGQMSYSSPIYDATRLSNVKL